MVRSAGSPMFRGSRRAQTDSRALGRSWVNVLREVPLFAELSKRHLARLADIAQQTRYVPQSTIVREGSRGNHFFVVLDGRASVFVHDDQKGVLEAGDPFGEMSLLDGLPRSATVVAETEVLTLRLSRNRFVELLRSEPSLTLQLLRTLSMRVRALEGGLL
jgi:CRP-like cAMP-binding protein